MLEKEAHVWWWWDEVKIGLEESEDKKEEILMDFKSCENIEAGRILIVGWF